MIKEQETIEHSTSGVFRNNRDSLTKLRRDRDETFLSIGSQKKVIQFRCLIWISTPKREIFPRSLRKSLCRRVSKALNFSLFVHVCVLA